MAIQPDKAASGRGKDSNKSGERAEVRYFKGEEQFERWRREFIHNQDNELRLAAVSKLSYDPADYDTLLVREPFPELVLTDYSYLIDKAVTAAENSYNYPIGTRVAVIVSLFVILVIFFSPLMLLIAGALLGAAVVSLYFTKKDRENAIKAADLAARDEITQRNEKERLAYEEKKGQHEAKETARISLVQNLLTGEPSAVRARIDEVLNRLKLPVFVEVEVDFYADIPMLRIWLPSKAVIPKQTCEMLPSGRLQYEDKDTRVFNKQYFELCGAISLQIASVVLANIPSFQEAYVAGLVKNDQADECIIAVKISKDDIGILNRSGNAIAALQSFKAVYECDTALMLYPVEMLMPPEWEGMDKQQLKGLKVRIFK